MYSCSCCSYGFSLWLFGSIPPSCRGKFCFFGDNYSLLIPGKIFTANWLKLGVVPLWNPYVMSGVSWVGDISQSMSYPTTLLFMVFQPGMALTFTVVLHLLIAMVGMYLLAYALTKNTLSSLFASVLWGLSTQLTGNINNLATLQTLPWAPLVIVSGINITKGRKWFWTFIGSVCLQILAGYPQYVMYTLIGAFAFSIFNNVVSKEKLSKLIFAWFSAGIIIFLLTAPITLPFIQSLKESTRTQQNAKQAAVGSARPSDVVKVLIPYFFDNASKGIKWGPSWNGLPNMMFYLTWIGIIFCFLPFTQKSNVKKQACFLVVFSIVFLLLSLGENLPYYSVVQEVVPLFKAARGPSLAMFLTNISLILLSSVGLSFYLRKKNALLETFSHT